MVHHVESLIVEIALQRAQTEARSSRAREVARWMSPGVWPTILTRDRECAEKLLAEPGIVRCGRIGSATLRCARTRAMVDEWLAIVEREPQRWLPEGFVGCLENLAEGEERSDPGLIRIST